MSASASARATREWRIAVIYQMIVNCANDGRPAPTNAEMREKIILRSISSVSEIVATLEQRNMIRVQRTADARIIEVIETGKSTSRPAIWKTHVRRKRSAAQQEMADQFDDALADTGSVAEAAKICGLNLPAAERRFTAIRKELGWQAS